MTKEKIIILREKCDPSLSKDINLPCNAYLVEYMDGDKQCFDITQCGKTVDLFDHYYDKYKKDFVTFKQAGGIVNPKSWYPAGQEPKKPKRKRKD